jgi:hypothetical protein
MKPELAGALGAFVVATLIAVPPAATQQKPPPTQNPVLLSSLPVPAMVSLQSGNLNTQTLTNPVLETFQQS